MTHSAAVSLFALAAGAAKSVLRAARNCQLRGSVCVLTSSPLTLGPNEADISDPVSVRSGSRVPVCTFTYLASDMRRISEQSGGPASAAGVTRGN